MDLQAEADRQCAKLPRHFSKSSAPSCNKVALLTGATGFLGAYLLANLCQHGFSRVYCLVRAVDNVAAQQRVQQHLQNYGLWQTEFADKIVVLAGDLSQSDWLNQASDMDALRAEVSHIYHNAAQVNSLYPYERLCHSNVGSTRRLLALAAQGCAKSFHYISTLAVFFSPAYVEKKRIFETDQADGVGMKGGYKQTKWVAEQLVLQAQRTGLDARIYRTTRLLGHSQTGAMQNLKDLLCTLLNASAQLGFYPDLDTEVNILPIDYAADTICQLSLRTSPDHQVYHICHHQSLNWQVFFAALCQQKPDLQQLPFADWIDLLQQQSLLQPKNKLLLSLRFLLRSPTQLTLPKPQFDNQQMRNGVDKEPMPIDQALLQRYVAYFERIGFIR